VVEAGVVTTKHFATKQDLEMFATKKDFNDFKMEIYEFRKETRDGFKNMEENFKQINDKLGELKSSANALDKILEQHPIQRIERLESHANLSPFVPTVEEE